MLIVVKFGGNALASNEASIFSEITALRACGHRIVLVHGGGPEIDEALTLRGVAIERFNGLRVTDALTLEITEAVLCGTINKRLVRAARTHELPAVGLSGQDGDLLVAEAMHPDLGYVGEIVTVNPRPLETLLAADYLPIVAPLAVSVDRGSAYNVNADTAAGAIAGALGADAFIVVTNVERVLADPNDPNSRIDRLSLAQARAFMKSESCRDSMLPKMQAVISALNSGVRRGYICGAKPAALQQALLGDATVLDMPERPW